MKYPAAHPRLVALPYRTGWIRGREIAVYLNRDVTTVQRWEKREGMPVHRHIHSRMGSVYSFSLRVGRVGAGPESSSRSRERGRYHSSSIPSR